MKNLILFISTILFCSLSVQGQSEQSSSLLWEISGKKVKSPSYIFGTMHLIPEKDFLFPETLKKKVASSDILVMEIGGLSEQFKAMQLMMLDSGSMFDPFTEAQLDSIFTYGEENLGFTEEMMRMSFNKMKPFVLIQLFMKESFGDNPQSYELTLEKIAKEHDVEIIGLETIEEQMGFIDNLSQEDQVEMVMESIRSKDGGLSETRELTNIYLSQNIDSLYNFTTSKDISPEFEENFLIKRNQKWIEPISKIIKKNKAFIGVGAAHLGGPEGVIELLRKEGYTLTPVQL
ncbi:TraB/GumN family protein [Brumimicrobium aurantiacum]|uniref:TraB/GumN family protein n=1 Tax=Brumimicrobium aurantiacum TaxID=1737063 RepID=A0A3E1F031_9FLAO|nr:TraB/GumN family protein [Brumimicrobium aurantiacum]RFC55158.1 TraB/GumN family protein [Brumimicrobium aurantiacum]